MCPLRARQQGHTRGWLSLGGWGQLDLHLLVNEQLPASPAMGSPTPVSPEQGSGPNRERMEQHAHPTWLLRVPAMPLTLLSQETASTLADASRIHETQAAISLTALFGRRESLPSRAMQRPISLKDKVLPREAIAFEGQGHLGWRIARGGSRVLFRHWEGRSKLGGAQRLRRELMT
jgi:hypothetical protein